LQDALRYERLLIKGSYISLLGVIPTFAQPAAI